MIYFCSQKNRRALVLQSANLNGIDYLEVAKDSDGCGRQLLITMLKSSQGLTLSTSQVQISGGTEASQVTAVSISVGTVSAPKVITVELNQPGDFSTYTFSFVANQSTADPPDGFDPQLSTVTFSFKAGCPTVADCLPCDCCPPDTTPEPDINYLAKDYGGFRQVMLDRMAVLAPAWTETHASDIGIALVETLAYAADHLSYQQDAVGTEAYIGTARSRISLRRLAKLVDYQLNEGSNARTWVYLNTLADNVSIPSGTLVFPRVPGFVTIIQPNTPQSATLLTNPLGFATMQAATLYVEQNELNFYTWGDNDCCLPSGATTATLVRNTANVTNTLTPGQILIFEEIVGPNTGDPEDANPNHRWAVRLTGVRYYNYHNLPLVDPLNGAPIVQISWAADDALPFPLCISSTTDAAHNSIALSAVSVARGNIVPADHGVWQMQVLAGTVTLTFDSTTVTGLGTTFTNYLQVGQWLVFACDTSQTPYQISAIANDTSLTLATPYAGTNLGLPTAAAIMEDLGPVPAAPPAPVTQSSCACTCEGTPTAPLPRYFPELADNPVTFAYPGVVVWSGTVALTSGSQTVTGSGTSFTTALSVGQWLLFTSDPTETPYQIGAIASDTSLTLTVIYTGVTTASTMATLVDTTPASGFLAPASSSTSSFGLPSPLPQIAVYDGLGLQWNVLEDLLSSNGSQRVCVLEIEYDGSAFLRFGDDQYGMAPEPGMDFQVRYRVGNGTAGNIGRDSLAHLLNLEGVQLANVSYVRNPLAAAGGVDPETMDQIRQQAPFAFLTQLRAVTEDDYGVMAQQDPAISEARGTLRWTGSWYTAFVSVDTVSPSGPSKALLTATKKRLNMFRMMGVDLACEGAVIVGLRIEMSICVDPDFFQDDVETALMQLFTTGDLCTGQPGMLNADNFTFGQTIYTSPFIAAAQGVQGVTSATMTLFQRMDDPSVDGVALGYLTLSRLEIARCDNDPNRLDHGIFTLSMDGGK
jgi:predicted phage baseplate assembly protein